MDSDERLSRRDRRLLAFARTAADIACTGPLQAVLDGLADEVLAASGASTCVVLIADADSGTITMVGAAGQPPEFVRRLEESMRRGAPFLTTTALHSQSRHITHDLAELVASDERFGPMRPYVGPRGWHSLLAQPLAIQGRQLGVLTAYYTQDRQPSDSEVTFLTAMADQAAVAVNTAQLFAAAEGRAALEERHRLARELHDSVAQGLHAIALETRAVQLAAEAAGTETGIALGGRLQRLHDVTESTLADMRSVITHMRASTPVADSELVEAVHAHARKVAARSGIEVVVHPWTGPVLLASSVETELFRVIAEAIENSVRHAAPSRVTVTLSAVDLDNTLRIEIADDGTGFIEDDPTEGFGTTSMRERVERLGGRFTIRSGTNGTTVVAAIPCRIL